MCCKVAKAYWFYSALPVSLSGGKSKESLIKDKLISNPLE
jgi:hypothetical protein